MKRARTEEETSSHIFLEILAEEYSVRDIYCIPEHKLREIDRCLMDWALMGDRTDYVPSYDEWSARTDNPSELDYDEFVEAELKGLLKRQPHRASAPCEVQIQSPADHFLDAFRFHSHFEEYRISIGFGRDEKVGSYGRAPKPWGSVLGTLPFVADLPHGVRRFVCLDFSRDESEEH